MVFITMTRAAEYSDLADNRRMGTQTRFTGISETLRIEQPVSPA